MTNLWLFVLVSVRLIFGWVGNVFNNKCNNNNLNFYLLIRRAEFDSKILQLLARSLSLSVQSTRRLISFDVDAIKSLKPPLFWAYVCVRAGSPVWCWGEEFWGTCKARAWQNLFDFMGEQQRTWFVRQRILVCGKSNFCSVCLFQVLQCTGLIAPNFVCWVNWMCKRVCVYVCLWCWMQTTIANLGLKCTKGTMTIRCVTSPTDRKQGPLVNYHFDWVSSNNGASESERPVRVGYSKQANCYHTNQQRSCNYTHTSLPRW